MADAIPNCAITLHLYDACMPPTFSFHLARCSTGWMVQNDGTIYPPPKGRVLEFSLNGFPHPDVNFGGFQVSSNNDFSGLPDWPTTTQLEHLGIQFLEPKAPPTGTATISGSLVIDLGSLPLASEPGSPTPRLFYRLAVVVGSDSSRHWHDPKIYDDGSI